MQAGEDDFLDVEGIGGQGAASLRQYFADPAVRTMLGQLLEIGLHFTPSDSSGRQEPLAGKIFLFTGRLSGFSRNEAKDRVKELGGQVVSSLSKKVTHLVAGEKPGNKLKKARDMALVILDEEEFKRLIEDNYSA